MKLDIYLTLDRYKGQHGNMNPIFINQGMFSVVDVLDMYLFWSFGNSI